MEVRWYNIIKMTIIRRKKEKFEIPEDYKYKEYFTDWDKFFDYFEDYNDENGIVYPVRIPKIKYKNYKIQNQHTLTDLKSTVFLYQLKQFLVLFLLLIGIIYIIWYNI